MGFFSGLTGSQKTTTPASGFYAQPKEFQNLYNSVLGNANSMLPQFNTAAFSPTGFNAGEQSALNDIYRGFTPNSETLQSDISMLTNPYDSYVIDDINRQASGANSLVNQAATQAGQQGSNRSFLGTSDVEQNRLNSIGQFRQGQYNNAVNQSLGQLTNSRRNDAAGALGAGGLERDISMQQQRAPIEAIMAQLGLLGNIPTEFGDFGRQQQTIKTGGGLGGLLGGLNTVGSAALGIGSLFSDERLKENILPIGTENGFNLYEFNYKGSDKRFIGVIAQEIQESHPEHVYDIEGHLAVNYDALGIKMREVL